MFAGAIRKGYMMDILVSMFGESVDNIAVGEACGDVMSVLRDVTVGEQCKQMIYNNGKSVTGKIWNKEKNKAVFIVRIVGTPYFVYFVGAKTMKTHDVDDVFVKAKIENDTVMVTKNKNVLKHFILMHFA